MVQCDLPNEDSDEGVPWASLAMSSSDTAPNPPLTQAGGEEVMSHLPPPASSARGGFDTSMAEVQTLAEEKTADDQGEISPSDPEDLGLTTGFLWPTWFKSHGTARGRPLHHQPRMGHRGQRLRGSATRG